MTCHSCQFHNLPGMAFCGACGSPLKVVCASCGFDNPSNFNFCGKCGNPLKEAHPTPVTPVAPGLGTTEARLKGERRHLTVMFCDLVGSTALSSQLDPEDLRNVVMEYQRVCQKVVARYEGHIAQYLGDGILVYFGYPTAHENDAHRAVSSGLGIIEAIHSLNEQLKRLYGICVAVRIGIHTGEAVIGDILSDTGQHQQMAHGVTLNLAARLEGLADSNTLIISADTYRLVQRFFQFEDRGRQLVKGLTQPINVYRVIHENTTLSRLKAIEDTGNLSPLVGRDTEIRRLLSCWADAKQGNSRIVLLSGEAGIGKSRIIQALVRQVAEDSNAWLIPNQCSPYHKHTAFYPFSHSIREMALHLKGDEPPEEQINRLEGFLLQNGQPLDEMVPLFAGILSIPLEGSAYQATPFSVEQQKQKITEVLVSIFIQRATEQSLLLIFEDLHWIDAESLGVLTQLFHQYLALNMLAVLSFRPEFHPPWQLRSHFTSITLDNLSRDTVLVIIQKIGNGKRIPDVLVEQIIQKTDGIPLFVEELTKMVLSSDIIREHDDHYELLDAAASLRIPSTLHDSLVARLDRMSYTKEIAQLGAAIGREFTYALVNAASNMADEAVSSCLHQLVTAELLTQRGVSPDATYKFRHALIRDAAYQTLLRSQRRRIHERIAQALVRYFPQHLKSQPEMAAYHFEQAELFAEAVRYWIRAGEKFRQSHAYEQALVHLDRGRQLIDKIPAGDERASLELTLLSIQTPVLVITDGWASRIAIEASIRMKNLAEKQQDDISRFKALRTLTLCILFSGDPHGALRHAKEALEIAQATQTKELLIEAYQMVGHNSIYTGDMLHSIKYLNQAIELYEKVLIEEKDLFGDNDPGAFLLIRSSHVLWYLGYPDQALERVRQALAKVSQKDRPYTKAVCNFIASFVFSYCGMMEDCLQYGNTSLAICEEYDILFFAQEVKIFVGYALVHRGDQEKGLEYIQESLDYRIQHSILNAFHQKIYTLADSYLLTGHIQAGLETVRQALAIAEQTDDQLFLSEIYRIKADLLFTDNSRLHMEEIERCLDHSMHLAKEQHTRSLELRTAMSIARLRSQQGRNAEGLEVLSGIYNWFTEGFETKDLADARELIGELTQKRTNAD